MKLFNRRIQHQATITLEIPEAKKPQQPPTKPQRHPHRQRVCATRTLPSKTPGKPVSHAHIHLLLARLNVTLPKNTRAKVKLHFVTIRTDSLSRQDTLLLEERNGLFFSTRQVKNVYSKQKINQVKNKGPPDNT